MAAAAACAAVSAILSLSLCQDEAGEGAAGGGLPGLGGEMPSLSGSA